MKISELIGETTEYDKKRDVEMRKPKSWLKNEKEQKVLLLIYENPSIIQNEIKEQLQLARRHVQKIMKTLSEKGVIERVGSPKMDIGK